MKQITLKEFIRSKQCSFQSGLLMALLYGIFAYVHLVSFLDTRDIVLLLVVLSEALVLSFFIIRETPQTVSVDILDWIIAIIGSVVPLFFRPADFGVLPEAALPLIIFGTSLQIGSIISLNKSYAVVPAKRVIKTTLLYSVVRHPLYTSYILILTGYILNYTSAYNVILWVISLILFFVRILREEKHLLLDPKYREYMLVVRYRIIPFIF